VKLVFDALTDQQPTGTHGIAALLAQTPGVDLASAYDDLRANVVALEITRTLWEKATILHAEHHRPLDLPIRDRFARHYADFEAPWRHASRADALARLDLLEDVVRPTRASSSLQPGPTTMPPCQGRSGSFRRLRAMPHWRGTVRRWHRCSSACQSSSVSRCSAFRLQSSRSTMGARFVPRDPHP